MNLIDQAEIRSVYDLFSLPPLDRSPFHGSPPAREE
jgi:hypothetical protein